LIVKPVKNVVIHHARSETGDIATRIVTDGEISLVPPGIAVTVRGLLGS